MRSKIYYTHLNSPWGTLLLAGTERAICSCKFIAGKNANRLLSRLQEANCDFLIREDLNPLASAVAGLKHYFSGGPKILDHPLDLHGTQFQKHVWAALREIPLGRVATYGEIAAHIGRPGGARAVGQACGSNPTVLFVPCHRVVAANGKIGGFGGGPSLKKALLRHEGVTIQNMDSKNTVVQGPRFKAHGKELKA